MGATSQQVDGKFRTKRFLDQEAAAGHDARHVVASSVWPYPPGHCLAGGEWQGEHYAAVRDADTGETWCRVTLYHRRNGWLTWKTIPEEGDEGRPSARVLGALTRTDNPEALRFRAAARAALTAKD